MTRSRMTIAAAARAAMTRSRMTTTAPLAAMTRSRMTMAAVSPVATTKRSYSSPFTSSPDNLLGKLFIKSLCEIEKSHNFIPQQYDVQSVQYPN